MLASPNKRNHSFVGKLIYDDEEKQFLTLDFLFDWGHMLFPLLFSSVGSFDIGSQLNNPDET